jgi:Tol biopolymer transport system component/DNA-binding winged helix-turn-helix (wHTH) protein
VERFRTSMYGGKFSSVVSLTGQPSDNNKVTPVSLTRLPSTGPMLDCAQSLAFLNGTSMEQAPSSPMLKFGPYLVDLAAGQVRKNGSRIRLQEKPLRVLALLAERQGQVVTREELKKRLWPEDTFVDFETGLNTAVSKLRDALSDSAENPRYIETVPRRGYRFFAPVEMIGANGRGAAPTTAASPVQEAAAGPTSGSTPLMPSSVIDLRAQTLAAADKQIEQIRSASVAWIRGTIVVAALLLLLTVWGLSPLPEPRVTDIFQVTQTGRMDFPVRPATDGVRIFYVQRSGDHYDLMQVPANGGEAQKVAAPFLNTLVWDVSPDGSKYLITSFARRGEPAALWTMPATGGSPVKLGEIVSGSASFSPDGKQIVYHIGHDLLVANADGTGIRKLANLDHDEPDSTVWSPDGQTIRFTRGDPERDTSSIWEIAPDGSKLHPILPHWRETPRQFGGAWTPDGRYFLFADGSQPLSRLYALREKQEWWRRSPRGPFLLASEATGSWSPLVSRDGQHVYYYGMSTRSDLETLDLATQQFSAVLRERRPVMLSVSPDGQWMSYIDTLSGMILTSHLDGSATRQIPMQNMEGAFPRLSPDNQLIAFTALKAGVPQSVYVVAAGGGTPQPLVANARGMRDPDWSPDGSRLVVDRDLHPANSDQPSSALAIVDLKTLRITDVLDSQDLHQPRWSPDGRYLAAVRGNHADLMVFDTASQHWGTLAQGKSMSFPVWSADGGSVYSQDILAPGEPLYRIEIATGKRRVVASFEKVLDAGIERCAFVSVLPNGAPMIAFDRSSSDIYGARLVLP